LRKRSMLPGVRAYYFWFSERTGHSRWKVGRFISKDGGYYYFQAGVGTFSPKAANVIELYHNEFAIIESKKR
jgi:hypothetical protein